MYKIISALLILTLLNGCHENPLKISPKSKTTAFLIDASHHAEQQLGIHPHAVRSAWLACIKQSETIDCKALYAAMVSYAQSATDSSYHTLTRADLQDKQVFNRLEDHYEMMLFNTIFED